MYEDTKYNLKPQNKTKAVCITLIFIAILYLTPRRI